MKKRIDVICDFLTGIGVLLCTLALILFMIEGNFKIQSLCFFIGGLLHLSSFGLKMIFNKSNKKIVTIIGIIFTIVFVALSLYDIINEIMR